MYPVPLATNIQATEPHKMEDSLAMATAYGLPAEAINSIRTIISAIRCGNLTRQQIHPHFRQFREQPVRQPLFTLGKDASETIENLLRDISRHNGQCLTSQESLSLLASEKPTGREGTNKHLVKKDTRLFFCISDVGSRASHGNAKPAWIMVKTAWGVW